MATTIHTFSSSDDSNDSLASLPDLGASTRPVAKIPTLETLTLSSDEEDETPANLFRGSAVNTADKEDLPDSYTSFVSSDVCALPVPSDVSASSVPSDVYTSSIPSSSAGRSTVETQEMVDDETNDRPLKKARRNASKLDKEAARLEKEAKQRRREEDRQRRAAEKAEIKAAREAERTSKLAMMPGECMKYVIAEVDRRLVEAEAGSQVVGRLVQDGGGVRYRVVDAPVPASITFLRVNPLTLQETLAEEAVVVIGREEFVAVVEEQVYVGGISEDGGGGGGSLCSLCRTWQKELHTPRFTLVVCGLDNYLKGNKSKKQQQMRSAVLGESAVSGRNKKNNNNNTPQVSRVDIETALVMAQLECRLNHRLLPDADKVATFILQITKAVAEAPLKQEREKVGFSWYAEASTVGGVRVDKNGVGLLKLWHQQLRQFNNVGVEVAQAIAREYPAPRALIKAYQNCTTEKEASLLLSDIPVRRGTGVLASTRRIGPELSKKMHIFLTTTDPDICLG